MQHNIYLYIYDIESHLISPYSMRKVLCRNQIGVSGLANVCCHRILGYGCLQSISCSLSQTQLSSSFRTSISSSHRQIIEKHYHLNRNISQCTNAGTSRWTWVNRQRDLQYQPSPTISTWPGPSHFERQDRGRPGLPGRPGRQAVDLKVQWFSGCGKLQPFNARGLGRNEKKWNRSHRYHCRISAMYPGGQR